MEDPDELLRRLKLGREEYTQRLLTMLILDGAYPPWNSESKPSERGLEFLAKLERLSFGTIGPWSDPVFVDELDLPRRHDAEAGSAPDWALKDAKRLWLIELKTEAGSHRPTQIPAYYELGRHHHPARQLDLTYLTGPLQKEPPTVPEGSRYAQVTWEQVLPLVDEVWGESHPGPVERLREVLGNLGSPWSDWRARRLHVPIETAAQGPTSDPIAAGVAVAREVAVDHQQRGVDVRVDNLEDLQRLRLQLRDALLGDEATASVRPWVWQSTSGGQPLTALGAEVGYELRVSWYR